MSFCVLVNIVGGCHKARHILRGEGEGGVGGWVGSKQRGKCASILRLEANLLIAKVL